MQEIRFHGRGGQGTVIASIVLAKALFAAGFYVQTFPLFGSERRGAPVEAYLRMDDRKIRIRSNVYRPDHVIILDGKLPELVEVTAGLSDKGTVTINSPLKEGFEGRFGMRKTGIVDASTIACNHKLGTPSQPIVNTAVLGAFAKVAGIPPLDHIISAILEEAPINKEANAEAAKKAYQETMIIQ